MPIKMKKYMKLLKFVALASFVFVCFLNQYRKNPIGTMEAIIKYPAPTKNYVAVYERELDEFKQLIPAGETVGYFADQKIVADEDMTENVVNYYLMQFFFAPVVFDPDNDRPGYLFVNSAKKTRLDEIIKSRKYLVIKQKGKTLFLLKQNGD